MELDHFLLQHLICTVNLTSIFFKMFCSEAYKLLTYFLSPWEQLYETVFSFLVTNNKLDWLRYLSSSKLKLWCCHQSNGQKPGKSHRILLYLEYVRFPSETTESSTIDKNLQQFGILDSPEFASTLKVFISLGFCLILLKTY